MLEAGTRLSVMRSSDRLVGSPSRQSIEYFHEAHGGFAIWLDPFGVLDWEVVVNLLPELAVGMDLVRHDNRPGESRPVGKYALF